MKKYLSLLITICLTLSFLVTPVQAAVGDGLGVGVGLGLGGAATLPQDGSWITDSEVTKIGKNAVRSGNLLDWTLKDYQWASSFAQQYSTSSLVSFWLTIQRIVYALFLFVVLVTAFMLIITRGRSLSAKRFLPRFFLVVLLVTFSFSLVQFLYQIVDIFQGFFLKNPQGNIISSKDLLYIGFDYKNFQGIRVFGASYDESALMSLLLVKLTAFTYYVMAILLIFRKIILWFLIIISPVFPLLLLFYPLRNSAKIWIGEFFRWLLYAPLFAIFLSGLVKLWQSPFGLPLLFNFKGAGVNETYPTAVNILLGGPGQKVFQHNSVNLPDTFALYLVALLMLWVVIILPFILLQIFLDNLMAFNYKDNPLLKQMYTLMNSRAGLPPKLPILPTGPSAPAGLARSMPFGRRFEMPKSANLAKTIPTSKGQAQTVPRSVFQSVNQQAAVTNLTNLSIPTMRDIARLERSKISKDNKLQQEISKTKETLVQVANPASSSSSVERDRYRQIKEKLITQVRAGNQVASTVLNAATTYNNYASQVSTISTVSSLTNLIKNIANPSLITSKRESEKLTHIKEQLTKEAAQGSQFAQKVLSNVSSFSSNQVSQMQELLQNIASPEKITDTSVRQEYTSLREKIVEAAKSGNPLAALLSSSLEKTTSQEQVKAIQDQLIQSASRGDPLATELLRKTSSLSKTSEKDTTKLQSTLEAAAKGGDPLATTLLQMLNAEKKAVQVAPSDMATKLKAGAFPVVNRIQQVSLDDYEAVKKMWKENYKDLAVPEASGQVSRKQWVTGEVADIQQTISLLSSTNPQDIEEGMKHVSDILPFLLIGGFSQTEIIAYLKAKMEAGKSVLEDGVINEEEDMLLDAKRSADKALGHLSASVEAVASGEESLGSSLAATTQKVMSVEMIPARKVGQDQAVADTKLNSLLTTIKLPHITMRDVVRFETAQSATKQEQEQIRSVLAKISSVDNLSSQDEKVTYGQLHEELIKESKKGNMLAAHILQASDSVGLASHEFGASEAVTLLRTLHGIISPENVDDNSRNEYVTVNQKLLASREKADLLAGNVIGAVTKIKEADLQQLSEFLQKLSNPTALTTASEQMHYNKLVERIAQASEDRNVTAAGILRTTREKLTEKSMGALENLISLESAKGDQLATYISESVFSSHSADSLSEISALYKQLIQEKAKGSMLAASILGLFAKQKKANGSGVASSDHGLPRQNRLQQVSLEDYETVKKMWSESYASSELDKTKDLTREQWITKDMNTISTTINLLSSGDTEQQQLGMEQVGEILPFLLLGGFSQDEVIGYLKAKLEAGKEVLQSLDKDPEPQIAPISASQTQSVPLAKSATVVTGDDQIYQSENFDHEDNQSESLLTQLGLKAPTLPEIVAYEAGKMAGEDISNNKQIGIALKALIGSGLSLTPMERGASAKIKEALEINASEGNKAAELILAISSGEDKEVESKVDDPQQLLVTLRAVLDPSAVNSADQAQYRQARDLLMQERQQEEGIAVAVMKLIDKVSQQETESVMKLLTRIDNPLQIVNDKERDTYASLKTVLERDREKNVLAASVLGASHSDITPVSANKIRVMLFESAMRDDQLATKILKEYVRVAEPILREATSLYQQFISKPGNDAFAKLLLELLRSRKGRVAKYGQAGVRLPKQNRLQQVSIDDYEAVKRMLYDMYLHSDVPKAIDGKEQSREEWVASDKRMTEEALSLLSSDVPANIDKGMELVRDVLPFLLLGGFSQNEVFEYLKAKISAATQVLQALAGGSEPEVKGAINDKSERKVMSAVIDDIKIKE